MRAFSLFRIRNSIINLIFIFIVILFSLLFISISFSSTIYINESGWWFEGSTFNPSSNPIKDAVNNSLSGDELFIKKGVYYTSVVINKTLNISGEFPIIYCNTSDEDCFTFDIKSRTRIRDLILSGDFFQGQHLVCI